MKIVKASYEILDELNSSEILKKIEKIGRVCYKSEDNITNESAPKFVKMLIDRGHEAMIEHFSFSVKFIVDRGVSHELVRHRLCAFAQESTRYVNYSKGKFDNQLTFIQPCFWNDGTIQSNDGHDPIKEIWNSWTKLLQESENQYMKILNNCGTPQEARSVLPNSLKTEIVCTANLREWRHILKLRTAKVAHPQMREVMCPLLDELKIKVPVVFDDIKYEKTI